MRIIFRADGNATIGLGHLVRSLALAEMVRPVAPCWLATQAPSPAVRALAEKAQVQLWELPAQNTTPEAATLATQLQSSDIVVLDGYTFDTAYQQYLAASGCRLVAIDDLRAGLMDVDLIINHSPGVTPEMYQARPDTRFCLGPEYSLLRPPFLQHARPPAPPRPIESVLLCFGGADPLQLTRRCLAILLTLPTLREIGVLTGSAFANPEALQALAGTFPTKSVRLLHNASAAEMVDLLERYYAVICPASTILIESLMLGKPALTGYYAENQRYLADYVHQHQQAFSLGSFTELSDAALAAALTVGLDTLAHQPQQPYVRQPAQERLRAEFERLRSR